MELKKSDWVKVRKEALTLLRDSLINTEVYKATIEKAEKNIATLPDDEKKA